METRYWTFKKDGDIYDAEFATREEAQAAADEGFAEQCEDESPRNGEYFEDAITLLEFSWDDDGKMVVHQEIAGLVAYEHYHGDYAEHFSQGSYV